MKKLLLLSLFALTAMFAQAQDGKEIWAKSYLGKQAPELKVEKWLTDKPELDGKYILLEFWATWCGPCRKAIPKLNALQAQYKDKLVIIGLSDEEEEKVRQMVSPKMEYTSAIDTRAILKRAYEVKGVPHAVLINPEGVVVWEGFPQLPGYELTPEVMGKLLK